MQKHERVFVHSLHFYERVSVGMAHFYERVFCRLLRFHERVCVRSPSFRRQSLRMADSLVLVKMPCLVGATCVARLSDEATVATDVPRENYSETRLAAKKASELASRRVSHRLARRHSSQATGIGNGHRRRVKRQSSAVGIVDEVGAHILCAVHRRTQEMGAKVPWGIGSITVPYMQGVPL